MDGNCKVISNREFNELEAKEKKIILESMPLRLMVILTRACNLECIMCPRVRDLPSTLPFSLVEKTFDLLPYLEKIDWQGGEVFLLNYYKDLFLKTAGYPHVLQHITTNGLLIDKEWAKIFSHSNVDLLFSIDAVTKTNYESIRRKAKFEDLLISLDFINDANTKYNGHIKLGLIAVVMKCNYRELILFPDFCKKYNFRGLLLDLLWPSIIPEEDIFTKPDEEAIEYLVQVIPQIENKCREYNIYFNCTFESYLKDFSSKSQDNIKRAESSFNIYEEKSQFKWDCLAPWKNLHVESDGFVYPECKCSRSIGNLREDSFREIWNGEVMQLYRRSIKNREADKICSEQCKYYASLKRQETK